MNNNWKEFRRDMLQLAITVVVFILSIVTAVIGALLIVTAFCKIMGAC